MYCSKCGTKLVDGGSFCPQCGNQLISSNSVVNNNNLVNNTTCKNKKNNINTILIISIFLVVIIAIVITGGILLSSNNGSIFQKNRVVMIYMVGADLESRNGLGTRDLLDLDYKKIEANNTKIILMAGGSKGWHNSYIDSSKTAIYELGPNGFTIVDNHELSNMGNTENLSYFLNYVHNNYSASKYNFIFWNHGGAVDGSEYDELNYGDNLSISEIKNAFLNTPFHNKNKLEVISFRTCLNATLEMANALKDYSKYLVASEEVTVGSSYDSALGFLNDVRVSDTPEEFGRKQIAGYAKSVTTVCNEEQGAKLENNLCVNFTYSIVDLSKVNKINNYLDEFSKDINKKLSSNFNDIVKLRASLKQYPLTDGDEYDMVDLSNLITKFSKYSTNSSKLLDSINDAVVYNLTNNDYSNGLSIYFPYNASVFLNRYPNFTSSKNYSDFLTAFYNKRKNTTVSSFSNFSMSKGISETTKTGGANFEIELTDEQVSNYANALCYIFVDMKDGYHKLVYVSRSPYLDGNKLKVKVKGKMLRISDSEYDELSEWLKLVEQDVGENYTESSTAFILNKGLKLDAVTTTIRIDKEHPNGFFKSIVSTSKDSNKEKFFFSNSALKLTDYTYIDVATQSYDILDENGKFRSDFLKHGNGVYTGYRFTTNMIKLIPEDFNSKFDYYGIFAITDVASNTYYSDLVKMN